MHAVTVIADYGIKGARADKDMQGAARNRRRAAGNTSSHRLTQSQHGSSMANATWHQTAAASAQTLISGWVSGQTDAAAEDVTWLVIAWLGIDHEKFEGIEHANDTSRGEAAHLGPVAPDARMQK